MKELLTTFDVARLVDRLESTVRLWERIGDGA
jgi:hypothetical protein